MITHISAFINAFPDCVLFAVNCDPISNPEFDPRLYSSVSVSRKVFLS